MAWLKIISAAIGLFPESGLGRPEPVKISSCKTAGSRRPPCQTLTWCFPPPPVKGASISVEDGSSLNLTDSGVNGEGIYVDNGSYIQVGDPNAGASYLSSPGTVAVGWQSGSTAVGFYGGAVVNIGWGTNTGRSLYVGDGAREPSFRAWAIRR